jgi:CMP-N-acetylneuraminic acid synthetase
MIKAIVPIKRDSERLAGKNFLQFCGQPLYQVLLDTLQNIPQIKSIIINTDSEIITADCQVRYSKAVIIQRPAELCGNHITMNTIISHDLLQTEGEHFLQTHVTNPLLTGVTIVDAINTYFSELDRYDSLFSVESIKKRVYDHKGMPLNHDNLKLEQTQDLRSVNIENSNLFLFSRSSFLSAHNSRVGKAPQLFPMSPIEGIDIDYEDDFLLAELIAKNKLIFNRFSPSN